MSYNKFKYAALGACAASALVSSDAFAQAQSVTGATITLQVQNAFTLAQTTALNFGTLAVFCDNANGNAVSGTITTAGAFTPPGAAVGTANMIDISNANRSQGIFDITNAAPTTAITVSRANITVLTCGGCANGNPTLAVSAMADDSTAGSVTTDANGAVTINVGATITTPDNGNCASQLESGTYSGTYDFNATY